MISEKDKKDIKYVLTKLNDKSFYDYGLLANILKYTDIVKILDLYDLCYETNKDSNPSKNDILFIMEMIDKRIDDLILYLSKK